MDSKGCCVCVQSYDDDVVLGVRVEWIQCACLRWLHEDCIIVLQIAVAKKDCALSALKCSYCSKSTDLILCKFISSICYSVSRARVASNVIIVHTQVHTHNMA